MIDDAPKFAPGRAERHPELGVLPRGENMILDKKLNEVNRKIKAEHLKSPRNIEKNIQSQAMRKARHRNHSE